MGRATRRGVTLAALAALGPPALAQADPGLPQALEEVGIDEHPDRRLPLDLRFRDEAGREVALGDYFVPGRPVLLSLAYYRCPMLCGLVLQGMVAALEDVDLAAGQGFELVTVSIDPRESPDLARAKKRTYVETYGRAGAETGWHFLTGGAEAVAALADALGFRYRYVAETDDFAHPAALFVLTPDGRISRYLYGVQHDPRTVRLSLVEASEGRIGTPLDQFLLYCYRYDGASGTYAPAALRLMRLGGTATAVAVGAFLLSLWIREARRRRRHA